MRNIVYLILEKIFTHSLEKYQKENIELQPDNDCFGCDHYDYDYNSEDDIHRRYEYRDYKYR